MVQSWMDNTGLYQKYGVSRTASTKSGEYRTYGEHREVEVLIDLTTLTDTASVQGDVEFFPTGMTIESVTIFTDVAAATGAALNVGLVKTDRTTAIDTQAFVKAAATATLTAGSTQVLTKGSTGAGNLIGGTTSSVGYITASASTSTAFTAGKVRVRIRYSKVV